MRVTAVGAEARPAWLRAVAGDATATISQTPAWLDCMCACGPFEDAARLYTTPDGRELVLPLARLRGTARAAPVESSMPFGWSAGGLVAAGTPPSTAEVTAVVQDLATRRALRTAVRPTPTAAAAWAAAVDGRAIRVPYTTFTLDL